MARALLTTAICAAWLTTAAAGGLPKPPTFKRGLGHAFRSEVWFEVRIVPHLAQRVLRVELWELAEVAWESPFADSGMEAPADQMTRWEPRERYTASDFPVADTGDRRTFAVRWTGVPRGNYHIVAKVITSNGVGVQSKPHRIVVH